MDYSQITKTQRNLSHWNLDGAIYWVTFRLADSIPKAKMDAWKSEFEAWEKTHPKPLDKSAWAEYDELFGAPFEK